MHTPDHKNKHVRKEFDPVQGSGYYQRDKNKIADIILDRQRDYTVNVSHYPVAFTCCKQ